MAQNVARSLFPVPALIGSVTRNLCASKGRQFASACFTALLTAETRKFACCGIVLTWSVFSLACRDVDNELRQLRGIAGALRMLRHADKMRHKGALASRAVNFKRTQYPSLDGGAPMSADERPFRLEKRGTEG